MTINIYSFTNDWFSSVEPLFRSLFTSVQIESILEIGCFEGRSTCFFIDYLSSRGLKQLVCIDTWHGGSEHLSDGTDMELVYARFLNNTKLATLNHSNGLNLSVMREHSTVALSTLLSDSTRPQFDFIYIDGSHNATDVLFDCVASFNLTRLGGIIALDDYAWCQKDNRGKDLSSSPKQAIDAFTTIYFNKLEIIHCSNKTWIIQKTAN